VDPDPRSKPSVVARTQLKPTSHKVCKNGLNSLLQCRMATPHREPWTIAWVEASLASSDDGAAERPVLRCHRLAIYSQPSNITPTVTIRS
jgi:hypothetical protein